jgi:hypothetical protein
MKKLLILSALVSLPAFAQWRHFGDETRATGFFGVGATAPLNPVARQLNTGWGFTGGVGLTKNYVGVLVDFMFNDFGLNRSALRQAGATRGSQKFWAITVDPVFHVNQRGPVDFYLTAGGGLYSRVTTLRAPGGFGGPFTTYKPGVDGGAGFSFNLDPHGRYSPKIFVEARYHHMFTAGSGSSFVPVSVGVRF